METPPTADLRIAEGWRLELSADGLRLSKVGQPALEVPRAQVLETIERIWLHFARPMFVVRGKRRRAFRLAPEQAQVFQQWLGDDYGPELEHQLKQRLSMAIPIGIFFILSNTHSALSWVLGGVLVAEGLLRRVWRSHYLFLFEIAFWLGLLARNAWQMMIGFRTHALATAILGFGLGLLALVMLGVAARIFRAFHAAFARRRPLV